MNFLKIFGFGSAKEKEEFDYPFFVEVRIYEQILPVERGERYEDPLALFLESKNLGTVSGGGSSLRDRAQEGERDIEYVNIDVELANLGEAKEVLKQKLIELGVPIDTEISYRDSEDNKQTEIIGELELLDIFIDILGHDEKIYENTDWDAMFEDLHNSLKESNAGELRADCSWNSETLVYFAGKSADNMFEILEPITKKYPVLNNARVVFHRKDKSKQPQEIKLISS